MKNLNVNSIVEAKAEYTKQLQSIMTEPLYSKVISTYLACEETPDEEKQNTLVEMQKRMQEVPNWNQYNIETLSRDVTKNCSYFSDLLAAVFVSNVKILTSIRMSKSKRVQIKMPTNEHFIHNAFVKIAEELFENPRILKKESVALKKEIYIIIHEAIHNAIRTLLPLQHILQNYMADSDSESESDSEEPVPEDGEDNLPPPDGFGDEEEPQANYEEETEHQDEEIVENDYEPPTEEGVEQPQETKDFFDNPHETKQVQIQEKGSFKESPFNELQDDCGEDDIKT
tara:strand:+ start:14450 stop:15304 length:855 start_codon:yes stop_codon:yes gene_type:complete